MLKPAGEALVAKLRLEVVDVLEDLRLHVGVEHRGQRALVLPVFGHEVRGDRDREGGAELERDLARPALVGRVDVGVQEGDRERLDPVVDQRLDGCAHRVLVERLDHVAVGSHPLRDAVGPPQGHERVRLDHAHPGVQRAGRPRPREMQDLLVTGGGEQTALGALLLEDHVGHDRAAVQDQREVGRGDAARLAGLLHARDHPRGLIFRCREDLRDRQLAGVLRQEQHVREGAAHVNPKLQCQCSSSLPPPGPKARYASVCGRLYRLKGAPRQSVHGPDFADANRARSAGSTSCASSRIELRTSRCGIPGH